MVLKQLRYTAKFGGPRPLSPRRTKTVLWSPVPWDYTTRLKVSSHAVLPSVPARAYTRRRTTIPHVAADQNAGQTCQLCKKIRSQHEHSRAGTLVITMVAIISASPTARSRPTTDGGGWSQAGRTLSHVRRRSERRGLQASLC